MILLSESAFLDRKLGRMQSLVIPNLREFLTLGKTARGSAVWLGSSIPADFLGLLCCRPSSSLDASREGREFILPHDTVYMLVHGLHKLTYSCMCGYEPSEDGFNVYTFVFL